MNKEEFLSKKNRGAIIKPIVGITIVLIILYALKGQLKHFNFLAALDMLKKEKNSTILFFFALGMLAVSTTTLYDFVLCKEMSIHIPKKKLFTISWICNTTNNFIGAGGVAGGGLRTSFYKKEGISTTDSLSMTFIIWLTTLTGLSGLILLNLNFIFHLDKMIYIVLSVIFSLYIPAYIFIDKIPFVKKIFVKDNINMSLTLKGRIEMVIVAVFEWLVAGIFFAFLMHYFVPEATFNKSLAAFSLAMTVSICSFIPGGIGSFDLTCIYAFDLLSINSPGILVGILFFRIFYYLIPWLISLLLLVGNLISSKKSQKQNKISSVLADFGVKALSGLTFFSGVLLIVTSTVPIFSFRFHAISKFLSEPILQFSHFTLIGIGFILIILSKGILDKVKDAYTVTVVLLVLGSILSLFKGFNIEQSIFLCIMVILLYLSKSSFYRDKLPIKWRTVFLSLGFVFFVSLFYFVFYEVINNGEPLHGYKGFVKHFLYSPKVIFSYLLMICVIVLIVQLVTVKRLKFEKPTDKEIEDLKVFLEKYDGNDKTHLLFLKDKSLFYSADKKALIGFKAYDDKLIALGDPIGDPTSFKNAICEFRNFADKYNMIPVFYEVDEINLPIYHENGFHFLKLGEEAFVSLEDFNLNGKKKADLRYIKNRIDKGIFTCEILLPPFDNETFNTLKEISDEWLKGRKEKGFSLGWFNKDYLNLTPIALVKHEGKPIGFASILPLYDHKTIGIDLMRLLPNSPNGTMDAVFYSLILWAKEHGYEEFTLGMAPLSNVGVNKYSNVKEKIARYVFNHGNKIYSFKGLRHYKEKFDPKWCGRYLVYPSINSLPTVLIDLAKVVSSAPKDE